MPWRGIQRGVSGGGVGRRLVDAIGCWGDVAFEVFDFARLVPSKGGTPKERPDFCSIASMFWV